jgi:hypothetical protein
MFLEKSPVRLELATEFLQSDNANVLKINKQSDLATRGDGHV